MDKLDLSDFFITKSQADDFSQRLNNVIDDLYKTNFDFEKIITEQFGLQKKDQFIKLFHENNVSITEASQVHDFLKKIQSTATNIPVVSLTIAFEPTEDTLKTLVQWFLFTLKKSVVFDIQVDPEIIAGASIMYNGKFQNYSIKPKLDETLRELINGENVQPSKPTHQSTEYISIGR